MPYPGVISLTVEAAAGTLTVRVSGELSGTTGPQLCRLLQQLAARVSRCGGDRPRIVVDLGGVGSFLPDGPDLLGHARLAARAHGVDLAVTGLDDRWPLLPLRVCELLAPFTGAPGPETGTPAEESGPRGDDAG